MKSIVFGTTVGLLLGQLLAQAQLQRGGQRQRIRAGADSATAEHALTMALAGPDGEYAAYAGYAAIVKRYGEVQPYASILRAEERHIEALKRHLEIRGLAVPENAYLGHIQLPGTLTEAAKAGVESERRNVALYDQLLGQVKDQPDLVRVFTHLQFASRNRHQPALAAAAASGGQLAPESFAYCTGCDQRRGGPPAWAGGAGRGMGPGQAGDACPPPDSGPALRPMPRRGPRFGAPQEQ